MFKFLKDKIQSWTEKIKEEFSEPELKVVKKSKLDASKKSKKEKPIKKEASKEKTGEKAPRKKEAREQEVSEQIVRDIRKEQKIESPEKRFEDVKSEEKKSFFSKIFSKKEESMKEEDGKGFFDSFKKKFTEEKFEGLFQELEMILLQNNVAYEAVQSIKKKMAQELIGKNISEVKLEEKLKEAILELLINPPNFVKEIKTKLKEKKPYVIVFAGINGSGKTTTIAKVAHLLKKEKLSVCLGAADTFRAAAIEQLSIHADNLKIPIIKKDYNADPASVGFEAIAYAKKYAIDVVLIDTAGRMNTKESLMKEMEKIMKVCNPDLKIFLGESITGNDATEQAKSFNDHISLDGIILSKADIDEKGGTALSVSYITKKPIYFLGTGQKYDDLEVFDKEKMVKSLGL